MAVAAYARIAEDLRGKIASRYIKPGGPLPSELELRDEYGASRNTVLDAIKKLKDEGLVETRPGQGWFARVRIVPFVNSIDWADGTAIEQAQARGRAPRATPPTVNLQTAPPEMADRLRVPVGTDDDRAAPGVVPRRAAMETADRLVPEGLVRPGRPTGS